MRRIFWDAVAIFGPANRRARVHQAPGAHDSRRDNKT